MFSKWYFRYLIVYESFPWGALPPDPRLIEESGKKRLPTPSFTYRERWCLFCEKPANIQPFNKSIKNLNGFLHGTILKFNHS